MWNKCSAQHHPAVNTRGSQVGLLDDQRAVQAQQRSRWSRNRCDAEKHPYRSIGKPVPRIEARQNMNECPTREIGHRRTLRQLLGLLVLGTIARAVVVTRSGMTIGPWRATPMARRVVVCVLLRGLMITGLKDRLNPGQAIQRPENHLPLATAERHRNQQQGRDHGTEWGSKQSHGCTILDNADVAYSIPDHDDCKFIRCFGLMAPNSGHGCLSGTRCTTTLVVRASGLVQSKPCLSSSERRATHSVTAPAAHQT